MNSYKISYQRTFLARGNQGALAAMAHVACRGVESSEGRVN